MRTRNMSVRLRLMLWNVGIVAFVLVGMGVALRYTTQAAMSASLDSDLAARSKPFVDHWRRFDRDRRFVPRWFKPGRRLPPMHPADASNEFVRFWPRTLDVQGRPYLPWASDKPWDLDSIASAAGGATLASSIWIGNQHVRVRSLPLYDRGQVVGVMQVASSLTEMDQALSTLSWTMLALSPLVLAACAIAGAFITGRAMRPVRAIAQASDRIGEGSLSERLPIIGNDDFSDLALTINRMLGRLDSAFARLAQSLEQQKRFTADASHELRTPLTAIKGNVSLALSADRPAADYRAALEVTGRAADNMQGIVQELLFLARSDANELTLDLRPVDINALLLMAVEAVQNLDHSRIDIQVQEDLPALCADPNQLLRAIVNLLINALRHTPEDGAVSLIATVEGAYATICVKDNGEGIPPEHLPHVFERFYRADPSRTRSHGGTGLGLAICRCIVEAHGGTVDIESEVGVGTTATVRVPTAGAEKRDE